MLLAVLAVTASWPYAAGAAEAEAAAAVAAGAALVTRASAPDAWLAAEQALDACNRARAERAALTPCRLTSLNGVAPAARPGLPSDHPAPVWRVRSGTRHLYLAGSTPALPASLHPLPLVLESAFHAADLVVVEALAQHAGSAGQLKNSRFARLGYGQLLNERVPAGLLPTLQQRLGGELELLQTARPTFAARVARARAAALLGYRDDLGYETLVTQRAELLGIPVAALANTEDQFGALYVHDEAGQAAALEQALAPLSELAAELQAHTRAWLSGHSAALPPALADREAARWNPTMLAARNQRLVDGLFDLLRSPEVELVVLGMQHLRGPAGVVNLLRQEGFEVSQLRADTDLQPELREPTPAADRDEVVRRLRRAARLLDDYRGQRLELEAAGTELRRVLELHPSNAAAQLALGRHALLLGAHSHGLTQHELDRARSHLHTAMSIRPDDSRIYVELGGVFLAGRQPDQARACLDYAGWLGNRSAMLVVRHGQLHLLEAGTDVAQRYFQLVAADPEQSRQARYAALDGLIAVHLERRDYDAVDAGFREQIRLDPETVWGRTRYARFLLCQRSNHEAAAEQARAALERLDHPPARQILGQALYARWAEAVMRGAVHDASNLYDAARRVLPTPGEAIDSAGNCAAMHRVRQAASVWHAPY